MSTSTAETAETAEPRTRRSLPRPQSNLSRHLLLGVVGLAVTVFLVQTLSDFRSVQLASMAALAIAAGGLTVLTGLNGQISLGHGALMAFGAYTTALLLPDRDASTPLPLVVVAAVLITLVVGAAVGLAAARLHGPYLAGATLTLALAVPGIALYFRESLGGEQGLSVVTPDIPGWVLDANFFLTGSDLSRSQYLAYVAAFTLIVTYILLANLSRSRVGRRWRAVRDDEVAAELAGINLGRTRVSAFVVSAAAAGAAGAMLALQARLAAPSGFTLALSLTLLAAVVLGGLGTLSGALIGSGLLTFLPQVMTNLGTDLGLSDIQAAELSPLAYGSVMVLVVLVAPAGIVGSFLIAYHSRRARAASSGGGSGSASATTSKSSDTADSATDSPDPISTTPKGTTP